MTVQHRQDLQMQRYTDEDLRVIARAAIIRMTKAVSLPTPDEREKAVEALFEEAPTFARRKALNGAAIYLLVTHGMKQ